MKKKAFTLAEATFVFVIFAIITVLFYKIVKPDQVAYNHLYYSAYTQLSDAFKETLLVDVYNDDTNKFDITKFPVAFNGLANFIGTSKDANTPLSTSLTTTDLWYAVATDDNLFKDSDTYSKLSNGMLIRFDIFSSTNISRTAHQILVATVDINGKEEPNKRNLDRVQFEINENGVFPIGVIETTTNMLKFNILTRYKETDTSGASVSTELKVVDGATGLSYKDAACKANLPRNTYYTDANKDCNSGVTVLDICNHDDLKCEIVAVKP